MWTPNRPSDSSGWVESTAALPVAFAQAREDPWIDLRLARDLPAGASVLMIASGGCTAALLATLPLARLHLVDINPAQLALTRIKLNLLQSATTQERLQLLGHAAMEPGERRDRLLTLYRKLDLPHDALGPIDLVAEFGLDHCGRYEWLFARLRHELEPVCDELVETLALRDEAEQSRRVDRETHLGRTLDMAFDDVMALPNLAALFGPNATANRRQDFSRHFAERVRQVLATMPAAENPYLHQMLLGRFPASTIYPWLDCRVLGELPAITWSVQPMTEALAAVGSESFDMVHLSNILDWLAPDEARLVLNRAARALRPGGRVVIRQLNSRLDIRGIASCFEWDCERSAELNVADRSFFYPELHIGRRR